eukprot:15470-Heterococcus_DN1.PRE.3
MFELCCTVIVLLLFYAVFASEKGSSANLRLSVAVTAVVTTLTANSCTIYCYTVWWRCCRLTRDAPDTQLALSLHAPTQELRNKIVPSASAYKLPDLMAALDAHIAAVPTHANSSSGNSSSSSSNAAAVSISSSSSSTLQTAGSAAVDGATNGHTNGSYTNGSSVTADVIDDVADDDDDGLGNFGEPQIAPNLQTSATTVTAAAGSETAGSETASANGSVNGSRGLNKRRALIEYVMLSGVNDTVECGHQLGTLLQGKSVVVNLIPYNATLTLGDSFSEPTEEALITQYGSSAVLRGAVLAGSCSAIASVLQRAVLAESCSNVRAAIAHGCILSAMTFAVYCIAALR